LEFQGAGIFFNGLIFRNPSNIHVLLNLCDANIHGRIIRNDANACSIKQATGTVLSGDSSHK